VELLLVAHNTISMDREVIRPKTTGSLYPLSKDPISQTIYADRRPIISIFKIRGGIGKIGDFLFEVLNPIVRRI